MDGQCGVDLEVRPEKGRECSPGWSARSASLPSRARRGRGPLHACVGLPLAIRSPAPRLATRSGPGAWYPCGPARRWRRGWMNCGGATSQCLPAFEVSFAQPAPTDGRRRSRSGWDVACMGLWTGPWIGLPAASSLAGSESGSPLATLWSARGRDMLESPEPDDTSFHDPASASMRADRARTRRRKPPTESGHRC